MKLLPMHYSATCGEFCRRTERGQHPRSGGFLWDGQPMPIPEGSRGAVDGSKGCRMGRQSQSLFQELPGRWCKGAWWLGKRKGAHPRLGLRMKHQRRSVLQTRGVWQGEGGGEGNTLHWCVLDCPVWTVQIPPVFHLCHCQSVSWPM